ncbi:MAG: outer membrane beta-barrel protein [Beijerinckiaceae bacterium]|nr:outer membrane beta-barrel protein [Beijerinckiaceae bacterium]
MQRMFSRRLAGATAGLLLTATSPFAADLAPPPLPPPPVPVFTWTGFELGVHVGGGTGRTTVDLPPFRASYGTSGVFGGIHVGFNYQLMGPIVVGVQGEYNFAGVTGSSTGIPLNYLSTGIRQFGSVDGRIGLAFNRLLIYAIGGFAYADIRNQILCGPAQCLGFPILPVTRDFAANRYGFDIGGGLEYNLWGNWTARAEYRYYNWGSLGFADAGFSAPLAIIQIPNHRSHEYMHTGRLGLTYKFAWPSAPVVASY